MRIDRHHRFTATAEVRENGAALANGDISIGEQRDLANKLEREMPVFPVVNCSRLLLAPALLLDRYIAI